MTGVGPFTEREARHAMRKPNPTWARLWDMLFIVAAGCLAYVVCRLIGVVLP